MEDQNNNFEKTNIALKFEKLSKNFKDNKILKNLNFEVKKGEFHGFIGSNGAGKTTTFRCLLGFYPDFTGNILINGISNRDVKQSRKYIGYIPEIATFPKKINVVEYLELMARFSNIPEKNAKEIVQKWLDYFEISDELRTKNGNNLSSGQKKKILLIQALISEPEILILDEPAANLDPIARKNLFDTLKKLNNEGKTIFISSHILAELEQYVDSITIIEKGTIITSDALSKLKEKQDFNYLLTTNNNSEALKILKENFKTTNFKEQNNILYINCEANEWNQILNLIIKNNLEIIKAEQFKQKLDDIYFKNISNN